MSQATLSLSPSDADDNDRGQEHFDATLLACGKAVAIDAARSMTADGKDDLLQTLLENWRATRRRFRLIVDGIESAEARFEIALRAIEEQGR